MPYRRSSSLAIDHKEIIEAAIQEIRNWVEKEPAIIFDYMPMKFTAFQLRRTYEVIYNREMDVRNFHKEDEFLGLRGTHGGICKMGSPIVRPVLSV